VRPVLQSRPAVASCGSRLLATEFEWKRARGQRSSDTRLWAAEPGSPFDSLPCGASGGRQVRHHLSFVSVAPPFSMRVGGAPGGPQARRPLSFSCRPTPPLPPFWPPAKISLDLVRSPPYSPH